jgi:hypothetical protein
MASLDITERRQIAAQAHADMEMWLNEAQKWADRFQSPSSNADDLISAATYFIIAAGNICLHAQSIVEVAYNDRETIVSGIKAWILTRL